VRCECGDSGGEKSVCRRLVSLKTSCACHANANWTDANVNWAGQLDASG
jgi:hypothetical protein